MPSIRFSSEPLPPTEIDKLRGKLDKDFTRLAELIGDARRPLPQQTGDGTYLDYSEDTPTLMQEVKSSLEDLARLNVTDAETLVEVFAKTKTGAQWDDTQYLMEKLIQTAAKFPDGSINGKTVTDGFLTQLYNDLPHPPISYVLH
jgi:hypothetical protein